jgi:hypothetical protein
MTIKNLVGWFLLAILILNICMFFIALIGFKTFIILVASMGSLVALGYLAIQLIESK